jgi:hypothetical protein
LGGRKFKDSRPSLAKNSEGGVGGGTLNRVFLEFGIKKSQYSRVANFQGGGVKNQAEYF